MAAIDCTLILAHQDDECLSTAGLVLNRIAAGKRVSLVTVFGRNYNYGVGPQHEQEQFDAWEKSCDILGIEDRLFLDLEEGEPQKQEHYVVLQHLENALSQWKPREVVIHDEQDRNQDHTWLSGICKIALRPWANPQIQRVLMCMSPDGRPKDTNYYVPMTESAHRTQVSAIESYARELRYSPHPRSLANVDAWQKQCGSNCSEHRAEPYRLYYSKD